MSWKLSSTSKARLVGINPKLNRIIDLALLTSPIDFGIPADGGLRTAERQNELFKQEASKMDGYIKISKHQSGNAFDFYAFVNGSASWDKVQLGILYGVFDTISKQIGVKLRWGGTFGSKTFNGWDIGHLELVTP